MYNVLIVGAGYVGKAIAQDYQEKKQRVFAVTRSEEKARALRALGIQPIVADIHKPETLEVFPPAHFVVISVAPDKRDDEGYYDTYVRGVGNVLSAMAKHPRPSLVVYISSTGVWDQKGLDWVNESIEPEPVSKRAKILLRAEEQVLDSGFPSVILRLSGIYGPGRNRLKSLRDSEKSESAEDRYLNMIHRDDIVRAIPPIFKSAMAGSVYIGTDDNPVMRSEFYTWLGKEKKCEYTKGPSRRSEDKGKRMSNVALKSLGFELRYPTFKEGYDELIRNGE